MLLLLPGRTDGVQGMRVNKYKFAKSRGIIPLFFFIFRRIFLGRWVLYSYSTSKKAVELSILGLLLLKVEDLLNAIN